jgi:hypothetical protein
MKIDNPYKESMRYIENAEEDLKLSGIEEKFFKDVKYVQSACGIAYVGLLKALDYLFDIKNVPKKRGRKSIEFYQQNLTKIDKKLLNHLNEAYHVLHLEGYYGGVKSVKVIEAGIDNAISIIEALKPYSKNGQK